MFIVWRFYVADEGNHRIVKWAPGSEEGVVVAGGNGELSIQVLTMIMIN